MKRNKRQRGDGQLRQPVPMDRYFPTPEQGLTQAQAAQLAAAGWHNRVEETNLKSTGEIIWENTLTFFNLVFVVLAALLVLAGSFRDMFFLLIAAINSLIGIVQQLRSRATLSKLALVAQARVKVVRGGQLGTVPVDQLVREDIVELGAGDQIPADGPVLVGQVTVNEALITGEADPIVKNPGDPLLSGSFVVSGKCRARMDQVGAASYAARLAHEAKADQGAGKSEMMKSLDRLIRVIGFALIPLGIALFCNEFLVQEQSFSTSITSMVAALIGMIPEGLYLLTSVALAVSVMRLAQRKTLVHQMSAIETLARVDVLCVDKTGTVTQPDMSVQELVCLDPQTSPQQVEGVLGAYYQVMDADNDTAKALARRFQQGNGWQAQQVVPFTSANKWSAVVFQDHGSYVLGAPEFILKEGYQAIAHRVEPYQQAGCRVLLLAQCDTPPTQEGGLQGAVAPVALVVVANPIRPEAPDTFRYFAKYGVDVKVISGDNPQTVSRVAQQAGIAGAERFVDAATLKEPGDYDRAVQEYNVFGRVTPDQKRKLVKALQKAGHTVAMTGDGVNDVLALKDADCGIAMASGAEAACQVAELVLLDSDFTHLPEVVMEGRKVIHNVTRTAGVFFIKTIYSVLVSFFCLFANVPFPFIPIQITLIDACIEAYPSFVTILESDTRQIKGSFLKTALTKALPFGLAAAVMIAALSLAAPFSPEVNRTVMYLLLIVISMAAVIKSCIPLTKLRAFICVTMVIGTFGALILLPSLFEVHLPGILSESISSAVTALLGANSNAVPILSKFPFM